MRICRDCSTHRLIEMQSDATPGTLIANAVGSGIDPSTMEEVEMTHDEYAVAYPAPDASYQQLRAAAYPPIGDQLDDLFRQGAFSPEMAAQLQAVKTAHPKGR